MPLSFDHPAWLLALLAAPAVVWAGRRGRGWHGRQQLAATLTRAAAVVLLVLALAGPRWTSGGHGVDVAFLVDASDSVGAPGRGEALDWVRRAVEARPGGERATLALFGADARLEYALREDPPTRDPAVVVDPSGTDIARALRLAEGALGAERRRRVVLLTDGRPTRGDLVAAAEDLAAAGVALDVVTLDAGAPADVLVEEVVAPNRVHEGEAYEVTVVLHNTGSEPAEGVLTLTADGREVGRETVELRPGRSETSFPRTAEEPGQTVRYEARLSSGASTAERNTVGLAAVHVEGPARVLVYARTEGLADDLTAALNAGGVTAELQLASAGGLPSLDRLLGYDSVLLVDVPAAVLGVAGMAALDAFVRDAGHGVVAVAGEESFGAGDYEGTPLEDLLPVFARITDPQRRPSVAQALVVDTSGSMGACHCRDEAFAGGDPFGETGPVMTDIAKEAVARAVDALEAHDTVGVLAFNTRSRWVVPLQQLPPPDVLDEGLARLSPAGDTDIQQAVREAITGLQDVEAKLRHIVLFTDGFQDSLAGLKRAAEEAHEAGITVSVVGTGEGSFDELREVAAKGGGRYYPGRDLNAIPTIITLEVLMAARPVVNEGRFTPIVTGIAAPTERLDEAPPLHGYLATTAKPSAQTLLRIGEERDPLLATWRAGLGSTVAWTSDVAPRWSTDWVSWDGYSRFWSDVVKSTFPPPVDPAFALSATATTAGLRVTVETGDQLPGDVTAAVTVTEPDGERHQVVLDRTGLTTFAAELPAGAEGIYAVAGELRRGGDALHHDTVTALRSYSPEYAVTSPDTAAVAQAVEATGGRLDPAPETAFDPAGLPPGRTARELWRAAALLGLLLAPVDVGLRRLRLERADWGRAVAWLRDRLRRRGGGPPPVERDETTDALFAAKARARTRRPG